MIFSSTHRVASDADTPITSTPTEVGNSSLNIDQSFAAGSVNVALAAAFTYAGIQALYLVADSDMTIKTNSTSSPGNTINLKAGRPLLWSVSEGYFANPITVNVTGLFITCAASSRLRGKILLS